MQTTLSDKEGERLRLWAREALNPGQGPKGTQPAYRESFAWVTIPLFDASVTGGVGGFGSSADTPPHSLGSGSGPGPSSGPNGVGDSGTPGGKAMTYELGGPPVQIDIPSLHRAKECYTEDQVLVSSLPHACSSPYEPCVWERIQGSWFFHLEHPE